MKSTHAPLLADATRDLASFGANLRFEAIPREAIERMKLSVLDSIACCIFGATLPWTRKVAHFAMTERAHLIASVWGMGQKLRWRWPYW